MGPILIKLLSLNTYFYNYIPFRLNYDNNSFIFEIIIGILLVIIVFSFKKRKYTFFSQDKIGTDQMRGIAIICVILFHYITLVFYPTKYQDLIANTFNLGAIGVSCFLMLSGYGLTISYLTKGLEKFYLIKRFSRILVPYWIITVIWLLLDKFFLNNNHSVFQILRMLVGAIVVNSTSLNVDNFTWYIGFILISYSIFRLIIGLKIDMVNKIIIMYSISLIFFLLALNYTPNQSTKLGGYFSNMLGWKTYFFSFPTGMLIAYNIEKINIFIQSFINKENLLKIIFLLIIACGVISISNSEVLLGIIPILIILYFSIVGIYSRLLMFLGGISYELYLLHGPLMVRYDLFLYRSPSVLWFFIYFIAIIGLSFLLKYITNLFFDNTLNISRNIYSWTARPKKIKEKIKLNFKNII